MSIRLKRLFADFQLLSNLFKDSTYINLQNYSGNPPERYVIEYRVKSLVEKNREIIPRDMHLVEVILPKGYPKESPFCRMLSPIFHPNISPQTICIGDHWAGEALSHLLIRVAEMMAYQSYNLQSPLNGEAARWTDLNMDKIPTDKNDFYSYYGDRESEILTQSRVMPKNLEIIEVSSASAPPIESLPSKNLKSPLLSRCQKPPKGIVPPSVSTPGRRQPDTCPVCRRIILSSEGICTFCPVPQKRIIPEKPPRQIRQRPLPFIQTPDSDRFKCDNCSKTLSISCVVICSSGHRVCQDCALTCSRCQKKFCTLCSRDKFTFVDENIFCSECISRI